MATEPGREDAAQQVQSHYRSSDLWGRIEQALGDLGKDPAALTIEDTAPVDEFHTRARAATRELAEFGDLTPGTRVLDVGSGLGGPARFLAHTHGCDVTGIDLSPEFCDVANRFSAATGLSASTRFEQGNALELPFDEGRFDLAWTVQAQMNIADKERFYGEIYRVLRPGGRLVFQDIMEGNGEPLDFPVPWAGGASISFLRPPQEVQSILAAHGFSELKWRDVSADVLAWTQQQPPPSGPPSPLGVHLMMGETFPVKRRNMRMALETGRICYIQAVLQKPA